MILPYFIVIPLLAAFLILLIGGKRDNWAVTIAMIAGITLFILSGFGFFALRTEHLTARMGGWDQPIGITLAFDGLTALILLMISLISLTSILFSVQYIRHRGSDPKYYALFMMLVTGMNGVVLTADLFNLYVFMEISLLAAFALVAFGGKAEEFEAAFKYAIMGALSSSLILLGIAVTYSATSVLSFSGIADKIPSLDPSLVFWIGVLFMVGFALKAASIPFHAWLPDAHSSAPAPISAMLSGVLIKTLGIYVLMRIFFNLFGAPAVFMRIFLVLGTLSILIGVLLAVGQWDMKRLLAYHSISQIGYILLGMGLATPLGILGAVFHLFNHALFKSLLFYNAGAVEMALGTRDLKRMGNLTRILPVTSFTSMVASLSISGIPPFNGFFSKLILIIAAVQAGKPGLALAAAIGSLLTLASFMKLQKYGFRGEREVTSLKTSVGWGMKTAMIVLAICCILSSLLVIPGFRESYLEPAVRAISEQVTHNRLVMGE